MGDTMGIEQFTKDLDVTAKNREKLDNINDIITQYHKQGYVLTLRQLYYQLVSMDFISNKASEYRKLGILVTKGRMAGLIDWDAIEDRLRRPWRPWWTTSVTSAMDTIIGQYRLDRQDGQPSLIEVWCEKDALSGVLRKIISEFHVHLVINRGYSSTTAMHDAFERVNAALVTGRNAHIFYLGDHDPSGLDMIVWQHPRGIGAVAASHL